MAEDRNDAPSSGPAAGPSSSEPNRWLLPRSLGVKVGLLLGFAIMVAVAFIGYVLYARGVFEDFQRLTLITDNAEGVAPGMDLTFSGFPIGRVRRLSLGEDGKARIHVRVPLSEARWLKKSSIFTLEVPLVGGARLRAFSANLKDEPLEDRAERAVLRGDTNEEIPRMVATIRQALENVENMTARDSSLQASINNAKAVTDRMAGKYGVLGGVLGSEDNARKVMSSIDRANALLDSLNGVSRRLDGSIAKADQRLLGAGGLADETQKAIAQANAILGDLKASLQRVDGILADAQAVAGNAKAATTDLGALRAEVEASLRKVTSLIEEINRKWPFERDTKIKLP
jgi:phospholipid/cholesterol/gamma-HCH transport system substrate-binding protein